MDLYPRCASASLCSKEAESLVISIVSHGHGKLVQSILEELTRYCASSVTRVILTLNIPEEVPCAPVGGWPFKMDFIRNTRPHGFGFNHNQALRDATESLVCVLNPDVVLLGSDPFVALKQVALQQGVGCAYPEQVDSKGILQDFERSLPTPVALFARRVLRRPDSRVDWVNAACLVMQRAVWDSLDGFDVRYFMYCEDVDFSLRLRLRGWVLARAPARVIHAGQRASNFNPRHLFWHLLSLFRLWRSPVYKSSLHMVDATNESKVTIDPS